jgi:hypothetical protein
MAATPTNTEVAEVPPPRRFIALSVRAGEVFANHQKALNWLADPESFPSTPLEAAALRKGLKRQMPHHEARQSIDGIDARRSTSFTERLFEQSDVIEREGKLCSCLREIWIQCECVPVLPNRLFMREVIAWGPEHASSGEVRHRFIGIESNGLLDCHIRFLLEHLLIVGSEREEPLDV